MKLAVTGANRGIGLALVKEATQRGCETLACIRSEENTTAVEGLSQVSVALADVRDPIALNNAAQSFGPLDLVVANAGRFIGRWGIEDPAYTPEAFQEVLMTNVAGVFFTARAFLSYLTSPGGKVAVISSFSASNTIKCTGDRYIYRASKAAVTNIATNLAVELAEKGIAVGAYDPGSVQTDMYGKKPGAELSPSEVAKRLMDRFEALSMKNTGVFENYAGRKVPY
ncbi:short-chain dehydrogenase [Pseudovibrio japonicus]|uniref:Short-chain dehydrogenase n=1 Tax=Pseudovibrio japonicus TaxID=366534 RepID=A0ABQ3DZN4_9HYPH|nr:SDR family NAD(P)-dependent oxidoreductase [Pseudovibrio japonicus]GHB20351.1 short-chain dehydrogenase [Pseudovibrio japonicus]